MVSLLTLFVSIGCEAQSFNNQSAVFKRAQTLDNGVSISWLEQTWNKNILDSNVVTTSDFRLLKQLGFRCIRINAPTTSR